MNPDRVLEEMMELATERDDRLSTLVRMMDGWMSGGGFLPTRWHVIRIPQPRNRTHENPGGTDPVIPGWSEGDR